MIVQTNDSLDLGPSVELPLTKGKVALISPHRLETVGQFKWCAKKSHSKYYAMRKVTTNGKAKFILMHRHIAQTPPDLLCHHRNDRSMDNRDRNLQNITPFEHAKFYSWR